MENIYQQVVQAVENGAKFSVDFRSRSLRLNGRSVIREGNYEGSLGVEPCTEKEFLSQIEERYLRYKHSVPSERSASRSRNYFLALPEKDLDDEDMLYGERRDKAQIELELYILCKLLNGFRWNAETMGKWFWQSTRDKDLVLLRQWIDIENN